MNVHFIICQCAWPFVYFTVLLNPSRVSSFQRMPMHLAIYSFLHSYLTLLGLHYSITYVLRSLRSAFRTFFGEFSWIRLYKRLSLNQPHFKSYEYHIYINMCTWNTKNYHAISSAKPWKYLQQHTYTHIVTFSEAST